jgi:4-hydroxybutyrate CoA-transferase
MVRHVTLQEALDRVPPGARVVAAPGCAAPTTLLAGLGRLADDRPGLHLFTGLQLDDQPFLPAVERGSLAFSTWHVTSRSRALVADGHAHHLPLRLADVPAAITRLAPEVALLRVSPPAADGTVSLGSSASYSHEAAAAAEVVLAEVDPAVPRTRGDTLVHVDRLDALVDSDRPTPSYSPGAPSEVAARIAGHLLALLPDAPTLQLGLGQVPEAVAAALLDAEVADLRFVGMGTDGMVDLAEAGLLRTGPDPLAIAAVELMGTDRLRRFADDTPRLGVFPSRLAHDPSWLAARFDRLVSVNSAIEVDLLGQVNSEVLRGQQVSAVGGSADYVDAARASDGGLSIIALPSTTPDGRTSRIVPQLGEGAVVTIPRHAYHVVVTEHGVADLRGLSVAARAEALAAVAAPAHRTSLT